MCTEASRLAQKKYNASPQGKETRQKWKEKKKQEKTGETKIEDYDVDDLTVFREDSRQWTEALKEGRKQKVSVIEYKSVTGGISKAYYSGGTYTTTKPKGLDSIISAIDSKVANGTYKAEFKVPQEWKKKKSGGE